MGLPRYWVNTAALSLLASDTDFEYSGLGPKIAMTRTYNSNDLTSGAFGRGWFFSYDWEVGTTLCGDAIPATLHRGDGSYVTFAKTSAVCSGGTSNVQEALSPTYPPDNRDMMTYNYSGSSKTDYWVHEARNDFTKSRFDPVASNPTSLWLLSTVTDKNGNAVLIARDSAGKISTVTDAAGRASSFAYDAHGLCTSITMANGKTASYSYDSSGYLTETVDVAGNHTLYTYDTDGYMLTMTVGGKTTTFTYDGTVTPKRLATVTDALGNTQTYQKGSATNALGQKSYYAAQSSLEGNLCSAAATGTQDALGFTTQKSYTNGLLTTYTDGLALERSLSWDTKGNLLSYQTMPGWEVTQFAYDASDNPISIATPAGDVYGLQYDSSHNITGVALPSGAAHTLTYAAGGLLSAVRDPLGNTTSLGYDSYGKRTSLTNAMNETWLRTYDSFHILTTSETDPLGNITSYAYDDNHRLTRITYADGSQKTFEYDCCSLTAVIDENGNRTSIERNALLKPASITDALGNKTTFGYDATNTVTGAKRPDGSAVSVAPDAVLRPAAVTNPAGATTTKTYDGNWNIASMTDERGKKTTFTTMGGMPWQTTDPLGNTTTTIWDGAGRLYSWQNARSDDVFYTYTPDSQIASKLASDYTTVLAQYTYDMAGNPTQIHDATGTTSYAHDAIGRVTTITYPDANSATFSYNGVGMYTSIAYPGGVTATYTYDKRNRVASVAWGTNLITFSYDGVGNLMGETRSNGTGTAYVYDKRNLATRITHSKSAAPFAQAIYTRNALGNVTAEASPVSILSPVLVSSATAGTYDDANQIISFGSNTYTYDADGNLTGVSGGSTLTAAYDTENRLTSITRGGTTTSYVYNGVGLRTRAVTGALTTNYYHDLFGKLLFQTDGAGSITAYYIYAGRRLVAMGTPSGGWYFFHYDKTGNTVALTDGATGAVANAYVYTPFGEITRKTGSIANPFTYVGAYGVTDEGGGLYFMKNRCYDAVTGRFMQKDPIGRDGGQTNLYAYAGNDPVGQTDSLGLFKDDFGGSKQRPGPDMATAFAGVFSQAKKDLLGGTTAVGNMTLGTAGIITGIGGLVLAGPEMTAAEMALLAGRAVIGAARLGGVLKNSDEYKKGDYGYDDAFLDLIDPTKGLRQAAQGAEEVVEAGAGKACSWEQGFENSFIQSQW